jgi:hypothetical protein
MFKRAASEHATLQNRFSGKPDFLAPSPNREQIIATTSQVYGAPQIEAKRELQRRLVDFVKQRAEKEGWKPEKNLWEECPTITNSVQ